MALKWAVTDKFHDYLYDRKFTLRTDYDSLTYVLGKAKLDDIGYKRVAALSNYDFCIVNRTGESNIDTDADALSRLPSDCREIFSDVVKAV